MKCAVLFSVVNKKTIIYFPQVFSSDDITRRVLKLKYVYMIRNTSKHLNGEKNGFSAIHLFFWHAFRVLYIERLTFWSTIY